MQADRIHISVSSAVAPELAVELGEVDGRGSEMATEPQRGLVFGLGSRSAAPPSIKVCERRSRFGPIGIEVLGGDEFGRCVLERFAVSGRLARGRNGRKQ